MIVNLTYNEACISPYLNISIAPVTLACQGSLPFIENNKKKCNMII